MSKYNSIDEFVYSIINTGWRQEENIYTYLMIDCTTTVIEILLLKTNAPSKFDLGIIFNASYQLNKFMQDDKYKQFQIYWDLKKILEIYKNRKG